MLNRVYLNSQANDFENLLYIQGDYLSEKNVWKIPENVWDHRSQDPAFKKLYPFDNFIHYTLVT